MTNKMMSKYDKSFNSECTIINNINTIITYEIQIQLSEVGCIAVSRHVLYVWLKVCKQRLIERNESVIEVLMSCLLS